MSWPYRRGELHGKSKFTVDQVKKIVTDFISINPNGIRRRGSVKEVSEMNPWMSTQNIGFICLGKAWPHITQPLLKQAGLLDPKYEIADCDELFHGTSPFWENMNRQAKIRREANRYED
jgi:hypothetical protein